MTAYLPHLRHAARTDVGRKRLANEDAFSCDPRTGLFVVCDGIGGQPSGEAASQIISHGLGHLVRRSARRYNRLTEDIIKLILADAVITLSTQLHAQSEEVKALSGLGCTIVGALIDTRCVYLVNAGDSRAYLLRMGKLTPLTQDHVAKRQQFKRADDGDLIDAGEKRLLMKYVGQHKPIKPSVGVLPLLPEDRLLLCSDGVTDPLTDECVERLLNTYNDPQSAVDALIDHANEAGGPDNITAMVIDYQGVRAMNDDDRTSAQRTPEELPHHVSNQAFAALQLLEEDLRWLLDGSKESAEPNRLTALAAVKRRLGNENYRNFLARQPTQAPVHIFHQVCTDPASSWRQRYAQHLALLEPPLDRIMSGGVRLSPLLTGDETANIYKTLWQDWRRVEQRYFVTTQREARHGEEKTTDILIGHMLNSVRTFAGLLQFLPKFMRDVSSSLPGDVN